MSNKIRLGLIFGGRSGEHEVSLMSAGSIFMALDAEKYEVLQIGITHEGVWLVGEDVLGVMAHSQTKGLIPATMLPDPTREGIYTFREDQSGELLEHLANLDVVFPVLHGTFGEDGTLQGFFEINGIAYVGAGVLGSSLAMDKGVFRDVMKTHGIPVVETLTVLRKDLESQASQVMDCAEELAPYPLFVKPANLGSSVGVSKCRNRSDLLEGLMEAARYDRRILVERGVNAREIEVSVLGNDDPIASLPGEVIPGAEFYSYEAKYYDDRSKLLIPAPISPELTEQIQHLALEAFRVIDCAGMARVDFFFDKDNNKLILNELNTIPGFTKISMYPKLWEASGMSYPALIDKLIDLALERMQERERIERRYFRQ